MSSDQNHICHYCRSKLDYTFFENYKGDTPVHEVFYGRVQLTFAFSLVYFKKEGAMQSVLHKIKYNHGHQLAIEFGRVIAQRLEKNSDFLSINALVPIPLHRKKEIVRGYNQSAKIAEGISEITGMQILPMIARKRHHESQTKKDRFERWENVENIFEYKEGNEAPQHIALVDDVMTTGATLEAACNVIRQVYPEIKISVLTIAYAR